MARPKYRQGDMPAREKLIEAFWVLLSDYPFGQITVRSLSDEAGLNHNTFYYHFDSMEDLAATALDEAKPHRLAVLVAPTFLHTGVIPEEAVGDPEFERFFLRMKLFAKPDSPHLNSMIRTMIEGIWTEAFGISGESLSADGRKSITFLIGGAMAVLGDNPDMQLRDFLDLLTGTIGQAARNVLAALAADSQDSAHIL